MLLALSGYVPRGIICGGQIAPARVQAGEFNKSDLEGCAQEPAERRGQRTTTTCASTSLSMFCVRSILCGRRVRCYASSRVGTTNAGAAAALQVGGLGDKFIADAQGIIGGQIRVFQRVERTADGKPGELASSGNTETTSSRCGAAPSGCSAQGNAAHSARSQAGPSRRFWQGTARWQGLPAYVPSRHRPRHPAG